MVAKAGELRKRRRKRKLTQAQLGALAGCSRSAIGHLETGEMRSVSPELAARIAQGLGVPVEDVFRMP